MLQLKNIGIKDKLFVAVQAILFLFYLIPLCDFRFTVSFYQKSFALLLLIAGLTAVAVAMLQLRKSLTPFPTPTAKGRLIRTGIYKSVRHPIYGGIILFTAGFGWYQGSVWQLLIAMLLWILFFFKSEYEERMLTNRFDVYRDYKKTTGRFFPFL